METQKLRQLIQERDLPFVENGDNETLWANQNGSMYFNMRETEQGLTVKAFVKKVNAAEQIVDVTLGETCRNDSRMFPAKEFICSVCGAVTKIERAKPRFCQCCGRKVVE